MLKKLKQGIFPFIIATSALSVSASAAFYSVSGLSKLFAGASFEVIIMAGSLEVAKLVIASLLYQYWDSINKLLRAYLTIAAVVLVLITSMGIYGFLSAAYQETATKAGNIDAQVQLVEVKRDNIKSQLLTYTQEKEAVTSAVTSLRSGLANNVIQYKDPETGQIITSTSSANRRALEKQLDQAIDRQSSINSKIDDLNSKLFDYESEIVEIKTGSDLAGELGPLKYLSGLTSVPMDKIINVLLLIIIFVFDPLAISLVVAANFAFDKVYPKKKYKQNLYGEEVEDNSISIWDTTIQDGLENELEWEYTKNIEIKDAEEIKTKEEFFENLDKLEKLKKKEKFDILDLNKDGIVDESEIKQAKKTIKELENHLQTSISSWRKNRIKEQINLIKSKLPKDDDQTKTY